MRVWAWSSRRRPALLVCGGLAAYLVLSLWRLSFPGLQYDEMLFANAALGGLDGTFLHYSFGRMPLYLMSYIGALKAWLYFPIFRVFGVSVASVRIPMILVSALGLWLYARSIAKTVGRPVAVLAFFFLATNATFLWAVRVDHGPVVLGTFFEITAFSAFIAGNAPFFIVSCILGLFQKIVYLFWLAGFLPAAYLFFPERRRLLLMGGAATLIYLAAWRLLLGDPGKDAILRGEIGSRLMTFCAQLSELLDGSSFYRTLLLPDPWGFPLGILAVTVAFAGLRFSTPENARWLRLLLIQFLLSLAIMFLVAPAKAYWHFYGLLPWIYFGVALALESLGRKGVLLAAIFLLGNGYGLARFALSTTQRPGSPRFTMAIYPLIDYCLALRDRYCASISWGTHTQLEAFTWRGKSFSTFNPEISDPDPHFVYVDYDGLVNVSHDESQAFFLRMERAGWKPTLIHRVDDGIQPFFLVYEFNR